MYFRLRLSFEASSEAPKTYERPESDLGLRETWARNIKIESSRQTRTGQTGWTDKDCDSLSSLTEPKIINKLTLLL